MRDHLQTHPPRFVADGQWREVVAADLGVLLSPDEFAYAFACPCGGRHFRVLGVPVAMSGGRTGFMLRSVLRVWRELRASTTGEAAAVGHLSPPIGLECLQCGLRSPLRLGGAGEHVTPPLEALRCRPCRRSTFEVCVVCRHAGADLDAPARGGEEDRPDALRIVVRCRSCGNRAEPYASVLRSAQQIRLDRLYGRDGRDGRDAPTESGASR